MNISEFGKKSGLTVYTIRYYEKKGLIKVKRDEKNRRIYDENDIEWIKFVKKLKDTGMLLRDIKIYSELRYKGDSTIEKRMDILYSHRKYVENEVKILKNYLENLDKKIEIYKIKILNGEKNKNEKI